MAAHAGDVGGVGGDDEFIKAEIDVALQALADGLRRSEAPFVAKNLMLSGFSGPWPIFLSRSMAVASENGNTKTLGLPGVLGGATEYGG